MSKRLVSLGDSFTEGVGDDDPRFPNGVRGWADRVAEQLAAHDPALLYANLAVRGKLMRQVLAEQVGPALALDPTLVTIYAGGNDLMRPSVNIDAMMADYEQAIDRFLTTGAHIVVFTGVDGVSDPVFRRMRGRVAIYNEHVRVMAARKGLTVVDLWAMRQLRDRRMWAPDRLHLNPLGHNEVAIELLDLLDIPHKLERTTLPPPPAKTPRESRAENLQWSREHAWPWIQRRIRGESSGDRITPKRPTLTEFPATPAS
ncbi:SGNH/GDSL hydrolase family protein [Actinocrispum sp. NPDC049592]|uniref:SGNH/GDSL hydrolase family protein n=1 Tax=Actinocrispum sp. NPDC049592 TaxID=3154835 RepID=UPI00343C83A3